MSLSIGEIARRSGLSHDALRYYGRRGLVTPSGRTASGHRLYDEAALDQLAVVTALRSTGFSIAQVRSVLRVKEGTVTAGERIDAMRSAMDELEEALDAKEDALRDARAQLRAWREELDSYRGPLDAPVGSAEAHS
ncbi:MerR family transcriptional regulator [Brachybacterium huguangmaarense]|uniref:MerR family transcriptional regulator n=1 Tax=Brachybacterium huguangmaarense TaxID=1652028 RepID=A0ABY6FY85_9MICO|nr:MerR family transcriptional regulator [Brachybacterium huguangmaarense]UYG15867.1 MerR family transcriptional regulator [Brachybacterium huguangmaarense]